MYWQPWAFVGKQEAYITVEGLKITHYYQGVNIRRSHDITVRQCIFENNEDVLNNYFYGEQHQACSFKR